MFPLFYPCLDPSRVRKKFYILLLTVILIANTSADNTKCFLGLYTLQAIKNEYLSKYLLMSFII